MKSFNKLVAVFCLFVIFSSCDDMPSKVGTSILPPEDLITVYTDTFRMEAHTVKLDSVFAKTADFLIGEMYDPLYGNIKADILCQFYCEEGFQFEHTPYEGRIDSMELIIFYPYSASNSLTAYGDTMAPMQVSVYPVDRPLKRNFYTNDNPENYCDMTKPLGSTTYTAHSMLISDSARYLTFTPHIKIKLPTELGQRFYDETINNPSSFESQNAFNEFFSGLYITNTFGSGCIIQSTSTSISMRMYYNYAVKGSNDSDSLIFWGQEFSVSKEVVQINRFKNSNMDKLFENDPTRTYIKSPAGVCTKLVIPTTEISDRLDIGDRFINGFNLELKYLPEDEWDFAYRPPSHLLLLPEDSVKSFFENGSVENGVISFISYRHDVASNQAQSSFLSPLGYNSSTRTYSFGNISSLLKTHIENSPDEDLRLLVLPVTRSAALSNNSYYTTSVQNSFDISGVKIRTEDDYMKVVVLSSKFENR